MFRISTHRSVCLGCRIISQSQRLCRPVSTSSAINRGLRATQDDQGSKRGARDRSIRSTARPRRLSDTYAVQSENGRGRPNPRTIARSSRFSDSNAIRSAQTRGERSERPSARPRRFSDSNTAQFERPRAQRDDPPSNRLRRPSDTYSVQSERPSSQRSPHASSAFGGSRYERDPRTSFSPRSEARKPRSSDRPWQRSARNGTSDASRQRPRSTRSRAEEMTYERRSSSEPDGELQKPRGGLFRQIKSACTLVRQIQEREAAGDGVDGMIKELRGFLKSTNYLAKSGTFKEEPSDAVAAFLQKHAAEGTFVRGEQRSSSRTVIRQRSDGELAVSVGSGGPEEQDHEKPSSSVDRKGPREARSERPERPERPERRERSERPERQSWSDASSSRRREGSSSRDVEEEDDIPLPLPYTTAASEFLYGYNTVLAALRAKQRNMYKLYIHPKIFDREAGAERGLGERAANEFVTLAKASGVPFKNEFKTKLLDRMSDGRPHNGVLLEASKLPTPPVLSLGKPTSRDSTIPLNLAQQSKEDAEINGTPENINSVANSWRHPLIVLLDGITDPGNLGNILRTCHFYGVDAVAVATNTCANLSSAVLAKASSGACEAVRLLSLPQPSNFAYESARNGWKIYASVAPTPDVVSQATHLTTGSVAAASPLAKHPCILMLGAEGEGLRENLRNRAHATVSIERGKKIKGTPNVGVDSINVGVAAGVLMDAFLRKPSDAPEKIDTRSDLGW